MYLPGQTIAKMIEKQQARHAQNTLHQPSLCWTKQQNLQTESKFPQLELFFSLFDAQNHLLHSAWISLSETGITQRMDKLNEFIQPMNCLL